MMMEYIYFYQSGVLLTSELQLLVLSSSAAMRGQERQNKNTKITKYFCSLGNKQSCPIIIDLFLQPLTLCFDVDIYQR